MEWQQSTSRLREYITLPSRICQDQTFRGKPEANSIGYALEAVSVLICGYWAYPRVQPATAEQTSRQQNTSSLTAPNRPPNGPHGLMDVDADEATCEWLLKQVPRDLTISFGCLVSYARIRRSHNMMVAGRGHSVIGLDMVGYFI